MAAAALPNFFTDAASSFGQAPTISSNNPGGMMHDSAGPLSLAMAGNGASLFNNSNNYGDMSNSWEFYNSTSIFSMSPLSDSSYDESDLLLMTGSDSDEFLQQINGCSPITMHPNLVHTLKNMVAPGQPGSVGGTMYSAQPSVLDRLEQLNRMEQLSRMEQQQDGQSIHDRFLRSPSQRQCCSSPPSGVVLKVEFPDLSPPVGAVISSPVVTEEPLKVVEKSETEENIEAAVVSVDLIKNRRPFRCQHDGCNKTFKNPQTMKMHHKTHYSDGSAGAKGCTLPTLTSSLKAGHNKKTPSRCPKCKKTFVGLYELRRHYGRKHSEGEKPFGCSKCGKKFYIEVDVRDHEKLCGKPIECKCGLKFAFKCNLVAHKKAHPACQDHTHNPTTSNNNSSSDDSEQSLSTSRHQQTRTGATKRVREESTSPIQSSLHIPIPDFKGIPEAPEFKLARHDFPPSGGLSFPPEANPLYASNMVYPTISFANLPFATNSSFQCQFKASQPPLFPFDAVNCEMGRFQPAPFKAWSG